MALKKGLEIKCPIVPNFIRVGEHVIGIADFTDAELKSIGKEWTIALLELAKKRRKLKSKNGK